MKYQEYEKAVYDWLLEKHQKDNTFTFSLRKKGSKGAETDYFIGTEKSNYFGMTFWTISSGYPGSSGDCIDLFMWENEGIFGYKFEFNQTKKPYDEQNDSVLNLIKSLENSKLKNIGFSSISPDSNKIFTLQTKQRQSEYLELDTMLNDIGLDLDIIFPVVDNAIKKEKKNNPDFEAHRITLDEFNDMQDKMERRFEKYGGRNESLNYWLFQGNPEIYDITKALKAGHLKSWKVAAHKDKIKIGDKVILWQTGSKAGCYALAEVVSEVGFIKEEDFEKLYYKTETNDEASERVKLKIVHYLADNPILWNDIKEDKVFENLKAGNQGTNFTATKEEFNALLNWNKMNTKQYWLFAPGEKAFAWDELYEKNIMGLSWDKLGDLNQYETKEEIFDAIKNIYGGEGDKRNDVTANYEFVNTMQIGDIIIAKTGRSTLLGYGIVTSDYYFDDTRHEFKHCRKVDWKLKGTWTVDHSLVLKTLTNITIYTTINENFELYYELLMATMKDELPTTSLKTKSNKPLNQILYGPPGTGKTYKTKQLAVEIITGLKIEDRNVLSERYNELKDAEQIVFTTFHQSMSYEDFVEGIKPKMNGEEENEISYEIQDGLFKLVCNEAKKISFSESEDNFDASWNKLIELVKSKLVTEELLTIGSWEFGLSNKESLKYSSLNTPSKYTFTITKQNVYDAYQHKIARPSGAFQKDMEDIVGFMKANLELNDYKENKSNTVRKKENYVLIIDEINRANVSAVFGELITLIEKDKREGEKEAISLKLPYSKADFCVPSNLYIIGTMNTADRSVEALDTALRRRFAFEELMPQYDLDVLGEVENYNLGNVLKTINQRIEVLIDRDHTIGHSYFIGVNSADELKLAFKDKIIPLLQEYFYGDYGKIGLVLGSAFVQLENRKKEEKIRFAEFKDYDNASDLNNSYYSLIAIDEDFDMVAALKSLMNTADSE